MNPLDQPVALAQVVLFFVPTVTVVTVAVVAIAHHEGFHVGRKTSPQGKVIRTPDLIIRGLQSVVRVVVAIRVDLVRSVGYFDS